MQIEINGVKELLLKRTKNGYLLTMEPSTSEDTEDDKVIRIAPSTVEKILVKETLENLTVNTVDETDTVETAIVQEPGIIMSKAACMMGIPFQTLWQKVRRKEVPGAHKENGMWVVPQEFILSALPVSKPIRNKWVSVVAASKILGIHPNGIYKRISNGTLRPVRNYKGKIVITNVSIKEMKDKREARMSS